jgi:hypothetical protein
MHNPKILSRLGSTWQRAVLYRKAIAELAACPPNKVHRIAQDVGLSERDLISLACNHRGPSELMPKRLQELRLDPAFVKYARTATYRDMERVCGTCKAWRRCARDLRRATFRRACAAIVSMPQQSMR